MMTLRQAQDLEREIQEMVPEARIDVIAREHRIVRGPDGEKCLKETYETMGEVLVTVTFSVPDRDNWSEVNAWIQALPKRRVP